MLKIGAVWRWMISPPHNRSTGVSDPGYSNRQTIRNDPVLSHPLCPQKRFSA